MESLFKEITNPRRDERHLTRSHWNSENIMEFSGNIHKHKKECDPRLPALERLKLGHKQGRGLFVEHLTSDTQ